MVFGETPFHGRSELELKRAVDLAFVTFKPECPISTDMKDFILKCLCKDPSERMSVRAMQLHPWLCTVNKIFTADNFFFGLKQRMSPEIIATVSVGQDMRKYGQPWLENK